MLKKVTAINEAARSALSITRDEYALCDYVHFRQADRRGRAGWCTDNKQEIAEFIGITRPGLFKMIDRLCREDLLFVDPASRAIQVTERWIDAIAECKQSLHGHVNLVDTPRKQSLHDRVNLVTPNIEVEYEYKERESVSAAPAKNEKPFSLKAEEKKDPSLHSAAPLPAAPPSGWRPVDPEEEVILMKSDALCREHFFRQTRLPLDRFDALLSDFLLKVRSESHQHNNRKDFRSHFFNWARTRNGGADAMRPGTPTGQPAGPSYANLKTYGS